MEVILLLLIKKTNPELNCLEFKSLIFFVNFNGNQVNVLVSEKNKSRDKSICRHLLNV
jgi:hypothetical protein